MILQHKSQPLSGCQIKVDAGTRQFTGYASVFNQVDSYGDTILPGAYSNTLKTLWPKMFFNHDACELPVGKWLDIREDDIGLLVTGEMTPEMDDADDVYAALKHGTVDGLSIGYVLSTDDYEYRPVANDYGRIIKNVSKLVEISIVTFPADNNARVSDVKSAIENVSTIREFEQLLRDAGGFSKNQAQQLVAQAKSIFSAGDRTGSVDLSPVLQKLQSLNKNL